MTWDTLIPHELVQWLPIILIALLAIYAMFRNNLRPREPAPPRRFSFGRMLLVALFRRREFPRLYARGCAG